MKDGDVLTYKFHPSVVEHSMSMNNYYNVSHGLHSNQYLVRVLLFPVIMRQPNAMGHYDPRT